MTSGGWIISHRCSWITVYVFYRNAQSESHSDPHNICMLSLLYQLPNCNFFTQHVLFILWRDTTSELWTSVHSFYIAITILLLLALFTFSHTITFYHSVLSILCLQQTGEIDNLIVSWGKLLGCVVCRFHVAAGEECDAPNRHLAYRSDHATTRTVSLWKRPPGIMCTSKHTHYAGGIE
jgi:hypothetical protein